MQVVEPTLAYVWVWLPGATDPVVVGRLDQRGSVVDFTYAASYRERSDAIALYLPELPLVRGRQAPARDVIAGCIADASPDGWGCRVIDNRLRGTEAGSGPDLGTLTYLLQSGSDRVGGLDFQTSSSEYRPRPDDEDVATLDELFRAAELVDEGTPLTPDLDAALRHGSSIGGARPKVTLRRDDRSLIAKFASSSDRLAYVPLEFIAMELGLRVGLDVARVEVTEALGKAVLLVERFDRPGGGERRLMVSAQTVLQLGPLGTDGSYADLANQVRARFDRPTQTMRELFARIVFSILVGNTDDHARNHAAFWDGEGLSLTPAYDICPQVRTGGEASQVMAIGPSGDSTSSLELCVAACAQYGLRPSEAKEIIDHQVETIVSEWPAVVEASGLTVADERQVAGTQFLPPFAFDGYGPRVTLRTR